MTNDRDRYLRLLLAEREGAAARFMHSKISLTEAERMNEEEWASFSHGRFVSVQIETLDYKRLQLIDSALGRLESGEFGFCIECEKPISPKRLNVLPWANRCVICQERLGEAERSGAPAATVA